MVRREGLEPSHLAAYAPQAYVSTNFTTFAYKILLRILRRSLWALFRRSFFKTFHLLRTFLELLF